MFGIGAALGLAGMVYSGIKSAQANKRANRQLQEQRDQINKTAIENDNLLSLAMNRDYTQTAGYQRANTQMRRLMQENNEQVAGTNAVIGGTRASEAVAKAQGNQALAEMASRAVVNGEQQAEQARTQRVQNKQWKENALAGVSAQQAQLDITNAQQNALAATQLASVAGSMIDQGVSGALNASGKTGGNNAVHTDSLWNRFNPGNQANTSGKGFLDSFSNMRRMYGQIG